MKEIDQYLEAVESARGVSLGSARASSAVPGASPETPDDIRYSKRRLPHFERPWAKYAIEFSTYERRQLAPAERDVILQSILYGHEHDQYELYVACVMPDHVHLLFEPQIKDQNEGGGAVFWPLKDILHGIKSASAHRINKLHGTIGRVWEKESFDRIIRSERDLQEKFRYICRNPWDSGVVRPRRLSMVMDTGCGFGGAAEAGTRGACAPRKTSDHASNISPT